MTPRLAALVALAMSCNGDCSQNAVVVVEQVKAIAPTISTIEVASDLDENGELTNGLNGPDERGFVIDPRPFIKKHIRIEFMLDVSRDALAVPPPCGSPPCPDSFLEFSSVFDPFPEPWIDAVFFDDDPADTAMTGSARVVTYVLRDNLISPFLATIPVPVRITMALDRVSEDAPPAEFVFVLARQVFQPQPPPRIVAVSPTPPTALPGWGRPITLADFAPGCAVLPPRGGGHRQ